MKRTLLSLALIVAVSAQAQITTNTKAKVDPKNNKIGRASCRERVCLYV